MYCVIYYEVEFESEQKKNKKNSEHKRAWYITRTSQIDLTHEAAAPAQVRVHAYELVKGKG